MAFEDQKFYLGKRLGSGSFGQVFLARNRCGEELAVKVECLGRPCSEGFKTLSEALRVLLECS